MNTERVLDLVAESVEGIVTGYVLIAEYTDVDGDQRIIADIMEDQRCHRTLGLLSFAAAIENEKAARSWLDDDEEEA